MLFQNVLRTYRLQLQILYKENIYLKSSLQYLIWTTKIGDEPHNIHFRRRQTTQVNQLTFVMKIQLSPVRLKIWLASSKTTRCCLGALLMARTWRLSPVIKIIHLTALLRKMVQTLWASSCSQFCLVWYSESWVKMAVHCWSSVNPGYMLWWCWCRGSCGKSI